MEQLMWRTVPTVDIQVMDGGRHGAATPQRMWWRTAAVRSHVKTGLSAYGTDHLLCTAVYVHTVSDMTRWCAKEEVPTGVKLNRYAGAGSSIPCHCDNERLFGEPSEPKVMVSMSLGHTVLSKLRRRVTENSPSQIMLDHGVYLVKYGVTQFEYEHLLGPRINLTFRWISQLIRSCPQAGSIGRAPPSGSAKYGDHRDVTIYQAHFFCFLSFPCQQRKVKNESFLSCLWLG